eukprot:403373336
MIKQIKICPSGVQIWKSQILASSATHFAFASTLAIYLYDTATFQLQKVFTHADQNISAIEIDPAPEAKYLTQATLDKKLIIWDIESENVKFNVTLGSAVQRIEWNRSAHNCLMLLLQNGEIKLADLNNKAITTIEVMKENTPSVIRWNSKRDNIAAIGYKSGHVTFVDVQTLQTLTLLLSPEETNGNPSSGVIDLSWDPNEDHLLIAFNDGSMAMIDFNGFDTQQTIMRMAYERQSVGVNCICWRDDKSGDFITSTKKVGTIRLWNVAHKEPKQVFKVGNTGIHYMRKLKGDSKRILIAFINGAVQVFNIQKRRIDFLTEAGHAETVFDLEFCPSDRNMFASCSYDGTVRVWDSNNSKLLQINDTLRNSPLSKENKHIIYSLSWHPKESKIALVGSMGLLMIYDALKNKLLSFINPIQPEPLKKEASFKVDWNQQNSGLILMGTQTGQSFVIKVSNACKQLDVLSKIDHQSQVFGVCWDPMETQSSQFAVGLDNGQIQICGQGQAGILSVLQGHEKKVFNVVYNLQIPNILASGSDDETIIIWNTADKSIIKILKGHTSKVRAITFNPELPWMLVSGAWDASIKLWDVRSGQCIHSITDHSADVYGVSFHPERPFVFASSSRDTTIRFFQMDALVTTIRNQMLMDPANNQFYQQPMQAFTTKNEYKLSSENAQKLILKAQQNAYKSPIDQLRTLYCYLNLNEGQEEIFNILDLITNQDFHPHPKLQELKVLHCAQIAVVFKDKADKLKQASGMQMYNTQFAKKEDRLHEAAKLYLRSGQFREYCEVLMDLGEYDKALNFAPAVGIEYWQQLAERKTQILSQQGHEDAAISAIISNQCDQAIQIFADNEEYEDGKLVKALQLTGVFQSVLNSVKSKTIKEQADQKYGNLNHVIDDLKSKPLFQIDKQLAEFIKDQSELFYYQNKPLLAVAAHLSISDFKSALKVLIRNNELHLAYYLAKHYYPQAFTEVSLLISDKAERFFQKEICLKILNCEDITDLRAVNLAMRRLQNSGLIKDKRFEALQLQTYIDQANQYLQQNKHIKALENYLLGNQLEQAAEVCIKICEESIEIKDSNKIAVLYDAVELIQNLNISKLSPQLKDQILYYSSLVGFFKSLFFGLYDIMIVFVNQLHQLSQKTGIVQYSQLIQAVEQAITNKMQMKHQQGVKSQITRDPLTNISIEFNGDKKQEQQYQLLLQGILTHQKQKSVLFDEPGIYKYQASGQNLQGSKLSHFTNSIIKGYPFTFEDGKTIVSYEEALEWAVCNRFSPLNNGFRINPY